MFISARLTLKLISNSIVDCCGMKACLVAWIFIRALLVIATLQYYYLRLHRRDTLLRRQSQTRPVVLSIAYPCCQVREVLFIGFLCKSKTIQAV